MLSINFESIFYILDDFYFIKIYLHFFVLKSFNIML